MKEGILKLFPVQAAPSDTLAFSSHCEKIFLGISEISTFSAQFFFLHLCLDRRTVIGNTGMTEKATLLSSLQMQLKRISKVSPG